MQGCFDALPPGHADIAEIGAAANFRRDILNVVAIVGAIGGQQPVDGKTAKLPLALGAGFPAFGDDLLQGRVGDEEVGEAAWRIFISAGKFGRGRHAIALRIAGAQAEAVRKRIVEFDAGVQTLEAVAAVQGGADLVLHHDAGMVVAQGDFGGEARRDGQAILREDAPIIGMGDEAHGRDRAVLLHDDRPQAIDAAVVGQGAEFRGGIEAGAAAVVAEAQCEDIFARAQRPLVDQLDQRAHRPRGGAAPVQHAIAFAAQRVGDGIAIGVGQDGLFLLIIARADGFEADKAGIIVILAPFDIGGVAIDGAQGEFLGVERAFDPGGVRQGDPGVEAHPAIAAAAIVGPGEDGAAVGGEQFDRRHAIAGKVGVGADDLEVQATRRGVETQIGIAIIKSGGRMIAPAIVMRILEGAEGAPVAPGGAAGHAGLRHAEAAVGEAGFQPWIAGPGLCFQRQRAAQGIEAIDGALVEQGDAADCGLRQQIELHRVAERLVEAGAVQIDGDALRLALQRGGGEAAIDEIGLPGIILRILQRHAGEIAGEGAQDIRAAGAADVGGGQGERIVDIDRAARCGDDDRLARAVTLIGRLCPCRSADQPHCAAGQKRRQNPHPVLSPSVFGGEGRGGPSGAPLYLGSRASHAACAFNSLSMVRG